MTYTYVSPEDKGYQLIKVSNKQHLEFFPNDDLKFASFVEYYYSEELDSLIIQKFTRNWAKVIAILIGVIPEILMHGIPETYKNIKTLIFERSEGHFIETKNFQIYKNYPELYNFIKDNTIANIYV